MARSGSSFTHSRNVGLFHARTLDTSRTALDIWNSCWAGALFESIQDPQTRHDTSITKNDNLLRLMAHVPRMSHSLKKKITSFV
jgi:hypothetical protein